ncbi:hypothetical protein EIKCOROL_02489 [Eikenella corrodens ATCC 23834]|uniref:Uncharacterized protein n=1 Tax=Eikenella corrodens ATCC 23834 TaxID=546274 RepID=C0DYM3_EIKCO|nr:hypothetical protein EIKCOROL_02489 [Eikenella corrodens ATCC 23834]
MHYKYLFLNYFLFIFQFKRPTYTAILHSWLICKTDIYRQFLARYFAQIAILWGSWLGNLGCCHFKRRFLALHYIYPLPSVWQYCLSAKIR